MEGSNFLSKTVNQIHSRAESGRMVEIKTVIKKSKKLITVDEIKTEAENMMKLNPKKKLMIKVLSANGYFLLKGYNDGMDVIMGEQEYLAGKENIYNINFASIYKASFYLI